MNSPDEVEVAPGASRRQLQGTIWQTATEAELNEGLEQAFGYRGDVTLLLRDGTSVEGYVFDRRTGPSAATSVVRIMKPTGEKAQVRYCDIAGLSFTGRDTAAGKSWEAWVTKYWQKKSAGEQNIELTPDSLSDD